MGTRGPISGMLSPILEKIGFFCLSAPDHGDRKKLIPNCHGRILPARWGKILFPFRLSWQIRPVSPPFGVGSRRHDGPPPRCPGRSGRRPSKPNHVAFGGSRRPSRRGRRPGDAAVPGFDREGARWVLPRSGEPGAADPAGPGARWALPRRGDLRFFLLSFPPRSQERNPPNHLAELPTRKREETAEVEAQKWSTV